MHAATSQLTRAIGRTPALLFKDTMDAGGASVGGVLVEPVEDGHDRAQRALSDLPGWRRPAITASHHLLRHSQCHDTRVSTHVCHQCHVPGGTGVKRRGCRETWGWSGKRSKLQKRFRRVLNFERVLNERQLEAARAA